MDFLIKENWAGYKDLDVDGLKLGFFYGWDEVDLKYLEEIVKKYPEMFYIEKMSNNTSLLKIKGDASDKLNLDLLLAIVDGDTMNWFELVDMTDGKLLNTSQKGQESVAYTNFT